MSLVVNDRPQQVSGETMGDILRLAIGQLNKGQVISRVIVDGREQAKFTDEEFLSTLTGVTAEVRVECEQVKDLLLNGLEQEKRFLTELLKEMPAIALGFRKSEAVPAAEKLGVLAEGLKTLVQLLQGVASFFPRANASFRFRGEDLHTHLIRFSKTLEALNKAQTQVDFVMLADVLEYELSEELGRWIELLGELHETVRGSEEP